MRSEPGAEQKDHKDKGEKEKHEKTPLITKEGWRVCEPGWFFSKRLNYVGDENHPALRAPLLCKEGSLGNPVTKVPGSNLITKDKG
jgi:hypothetical protein